MSCNWVRLSARAPLTPRISAAKNGSEPSRLSDSGITSATALVRLVTRPRATELGT